MKALFWIAFVFVGLGGWFVAGTLFLLDAVDEGTSITYLESGVLAQKVEKEALLVICDAEISVEHVRARGVEIQIHQSSEEHVLVDVPSGQASFRVVNERIKTESVRFAGQSRP